MGLMLSVLIECVGVLEVIACYQHLSYGIQHALDEPKPELSKIKQDLRREFVEYENVKYAQSVASETVDGTVSEVATECVFYKETMKRNENEGNERNIPNEIEAINDVLELLEKSNDTKRESWGDTVRNEEISEISIDTPASASNKYKISEIKEHPDVKTETVVAETAHTVEIDERPIAATKKHQDDIVQTPKSLSETAEIKINEVLDTCKETPVEVHEDKSIKIIKTEATHQVNAIANETAELVTSSVSLELDACAEAAKKITEICVQTNEPVFETEVLVIATTSTEQTRNEISETPEIKEADTSEKQQSDISIESSISQVPSNLILDNIVEPPFENQNISVTHEVTDSNYEIPSGNVTTGPFESIEEVAVLREVELLAANETRSSETLAGIENLPIAEEAPEMNGHTLFNGHGELRGHFQIIPEPDPSSEGQEYVVDVVFPHLEPDHHDHNDVGSISNDFGVVVYDLPAFRPGGGMPSELSEEQNTDEISELSMFTETELTHSGAELGGIPTTLYYHPESGSLIEIIHDDFDGDPNEMYSYEMNPDERISQACLFNPDSVFYRPPSPFPDIEISTTRNELKIPESLYETDSNKSMDEEPSEKPKGKRVSFQDYVHTEEYERDSLEDEHVETVLGQLNIEEIENEDSNVELESNKLVEAVLEQEKEALICSSEALIDEGTQIENEPSDQLLVQPNIEEPQCVFQGETSPMYVEPYVMENVEDHNQHLSYDFLTQASEDVLFEVQRSYPTEEADFLISPEAREELSRSPTSHINIQQSQIQDCIDQPKSTQITLSSINAVSLESQLSKSESEVDFDPCPIVHNSINIQNKQVDECEILEEISRLGEEQKEVSQELVKSLVPEEIVKLNEKEDASQNIPESDKVEAIEETGKKNVPEDKVVKTLENELKIEPILKSPSGEVSLQNIPVEITENIASEVTDEVIDENLHFVDNIIESSRTVKRYGQEENNEIKRFDSEPNLPQHDEEFSAYNQEFLNSLDGIKTNISRDEGSWRRKNFRNRRSLSSNSSRSSRASRDEELKTLTSLEESEQGVTCETVENNITSNVSEIVSETPEVANLDASEPKAEEKATPSHRRRRKHRGKKSGKDTSSQENLSEIVPGIDIISEETVIVDEQHPENQSVIDAKDKCSGDTLDDEEARERLQIEQAHASFETRKQMRTISKIASFEDASDSQHEEILSERLSIKNEDGAGSRDGASSRSSDQAFWVNNM